jgi:hypothetical protein
VGVETSQSVPTRQVDIAEGRAFDAEGLVKVLLGD